MTDDERCARNDLTMLAETLIELRAIKMDVPLAAVWMQVQEGVAA